MWSFFCVLLADDYEAQWCFEKGYLKKKKKTQREISRKESLFPVLFDACNLITFLIMSMIIIIDLHTN